jgi:YfiH family protein
MFEILKPHSSEILFGMTTREGEIFDPATFKVEGLRPWIANQIHTDVVLKVDALPNVTPDCDAFITNQKNIPLLIKVADCQAILLYDPILKCIGAVHSGWKGSVVNILGKAVKAMTKEFGTRPSDLKVWISPSLGPCCSEFTDPKSELPPFFAPFTQGKKVDFWAASQKQLEEVGVPLENLQITGECTKDNPEIYPSYRNGDLTERMGVFVMLR